MLPFRSLNLLEKCSLILAAALLVCLLPMPYGFYTLTRLAVAVIACCWAYRFYSEDKTALVIVAGVIALIFQPFFKIALDRITWNILDVALAGIIFCLTLAKDKIKL